MMNFKKVVIRLSVFLFIMAIVNGALSVVLGGQDPSTDNDKIKVIGGDVGSGLKDLKPVLVKLDGKGDGRFDVKQEGIYEIWLRSDVKGIDDVEAISIDNEMYEIKKENIKGRWLEVGTKRIKPVWGRHKISVISRKSRDDSLQDMEVVIVSEIKLKEYERLLKQKEISYLFYKEKEDDDSSGTSVLKPIGKKEFYIPNTGNYEISAVVRAKREKVRAYVVNEDFKEGISDNWNLRIGDAQKQISIASETGKAKDGGLKTEDNNDIMPVFIFGDNFFHPISLSYPLSDGMWRWMSQDGEIIIFNPLNTTLAVDLSFSIASFKEKRNVQIILNDKLLKNLLLPAPEEEVDKRFLQNVSNLKALANGSGIPKRVNINGVKIKPGINKMIFIPTPSAALVGKDGRFNISIAIRDDFKLKLSSGATKGDAAYWKNRREFDAEAKDGLLLLKDGYNGRADEIAWVTRSFDNINLNKTPVFILKYSWADREVQAMDVGFRIDTDDDGKEDVYLTREINKPVMGINKFEIDLLEEIYQDFPDAAIGNPYLVGIDIFPHRNKGIDISGTIKEGGYVYKIRGVQVASKEASIVPVGMGRIKDIKSTKKAVYTVSQDNKSLFVSIPLGGRKGYSAATAFTMQLRYKPEKKSFLMILPFYMSDTNAQSVSVWIGYDSGGDGKADGFQPLGVKVPVSGWNLITRDMKEPMLLYEAVLPKDIPFRYTTEGKRFHNFVVLKDGEALSPTWDNDFRISKEQIQVDGNRLVINLPRDKDPDNYNYELYYIPQRWIIDSPQFPGFKEYAFEMEEAKEYLPDDATPMELKLFLKAKLSKLYNKEKEFKFYFKAPFYSYTVLTDIKAINRKKNMPLFGIDDELVDFNVNMDGEKDALRLKKVVNLEEGSHVLQVKEEGALEAYMVEVKAVGSRESGVDGRESMVDGRESMVGGRESGVGSQESPEIEFKKINPTRYIVDVHGAKGPFTLVFSESFHKGWKAYIRRSTISQQSIVESRESRVDSRESAVKTGDHRLKTNNEPWSALWSAWKDRGNRVEIKDHFVVNGYANGWIVDPSIVGSQQSMVDSRQSTVDSRQSAVDSQRSVVGSPQSFEIILEYKPQRFFEIGLIISGLTLLGCIGYLGYDFARRRKIVGSR